MKKEIKIIINDGLMSGVELLSTIEFLEFLGYEVIVKGGGNV